MKYLYWFSILIILLKCNITASENLFSHGDAENITAAPFGDSVSISDNAPFNGEKCFELTQFNSQVLCSDFIEVKPQSRYLLKGAFRTGREKSGDANFGLMLFDDEKRSIVPHLVNAIPGTESKLLADVKKGDTIIRLDNAESWIGKPGKIVVFGAKSGLSDLPNFDYEYPVASVKKSADSYEVEFARPLNRDHTAGILVRLHQDGGFMTCGFSREVFSSEWCEYQGMVFGDSRYGTPTERFWAGTKFVKIFIQVKSGNPVFFDDISFSEVPPEAMNNLLMPLARKNNSFFAEAVKTDDSTPPKTGEKCFEIVKYNEIITSDFLPLDTQESYVLSGLFRAKGANPGTGTLGFMLFDKNKRPIPAYSVNAVPGTETRLLADVKKGDTVIKVSDASAWINNPGKIVMFDVNADFSDLPNLNYECYVAEVKKSREIFEVGFSRPMTSDHSAGSLLRLHQDGGNMTCGFSGAVFPQEWTEYEGIISGILERGSDPNKFWRGTAFIKIFLLIKPGDPVSFSRLSLRKISKAELHKEDNPKLFEGKVLRRKWSLYNYQRLIGNKNALEAVINPFGGFSCPNLDWNAEEIKQIEITYKVAEYGGCLQLQYSSVLNNKTNTDIMAHMVTPDSRFHTIIFPVCEKRSWSGKIFQIKFVLIGKDAAQVSLARVSALSNKNILPDADSIRPGKPVPVHYLLPRGEYFMRWENGKNPGIELDCLDNHMQSIKKVKLPAGKSEDIFEVPELAITGMLSILKEAKGHPVLELKKLVHLHQPPAFWRGQWIWCQSKPGPESTNVWFRKEFELPEKITAGALAVSADDVFYAYVNGSYVGTGWPFYTAYRMNITTNLKPGRNEITIRVFNGATYGGLLCDVYVKANGKEYEFSSDKNWTMHIGGGENMPEKFEAAPLELGEPIHTFPWAQRIAFRYAGKQGELQVLQSASNSFHAKIITVPPVILTTLGIKAVSVSGKTKQFKLKMSSSSETWKAGETVNIKLRIPPSDREIFTLYINDDYLTVKDNTGIGFIPSNKKLPGLAAVTITNITARPELVINGKRCLPTFFSMMPTYFLRPDDFSFLIDDAKTVGIENFFIMVQFRDVWLEPDKFDFTALDRCIESLLTANPDAKILLQVFCSMPQWWLQANPDDVSRFYDGRSLVNTGYNQALSSKKWLKDAATGLKALVEHVKQNAWSDKIIGTSFSESDNSEWFWANDGSQSRYIGFSKSDYAAFRDFLRKKYADESKLTTAWKQTDVTFDNAQMPSPDEQLRGRIGALLDPGLDRNLMDWFEYRNLVLAEAILSFGKVIKEATDNRWLTGAYYGYYIEFAASIFRVLHEHGHNAFLEVANSPYIDFVRAPSRYGLRNMGMSDGIMQTYDTFRSRGKLVFIEQDLRTSYDKTEEHGSYGRPNTVIDSVGLINRAFGMMLAQGLAHYWLDMGLCWYTEKAILNVMKEQNEVHYTLPPVSGLTPHEMALVGDRSSVYYTKRNAPDAVFPAATGDLNRIINNLAIPYRQLVVDDLLNGDAIKPCKFYIMTTALMLSKEQRIKLINRFEREKATVLWLYAPGAFYPDNGPSAEHCGDFLGLKMRMENTIKQPVMKMKPDWGVAECVNINATSPWFYPAAGFDEVIGYDDAGSAMLVKWSRNGATHYFSTLLNLPKEVLAKMAEHAGLHSYSKTLDDPYWIGNDVVFLHAKGSGEKKVILPAGTSMRAIIGPIKSSFESGQPWYAEAGQTYGFAVERKK